MKHSGIRRFINHLFSAPWHAKRHFSQPVLSRIEAVIAESERTHNGEIRFVVESDLHPLHLLRKVTPRQRALDLFSQLRIWDTADNNGVLIYLLLADRDVEIIADRGIHQHIGQQGWEEICREMETAFRNGKFEEGVLHGIRRITAALKKYFPYTDDDKNELPAAPVLL